MKVEESCGTEKRKVLKNVFGFNISKIFGTKSKTKKEGERDVVIKRHRSTGSCEIITVSKK